MSRAVTSFFASFTWMAVACSGGGSGSGGTGGSPATGGSTGTGGLSGTGVALGTGGAAGSAMPDAAPRAADTGRPDTSPATPDSAASGDAPGLVKAIGQAGGVCAVGAAYGDPLPANATATMIQGGFDFIEGPVWVESGKMLLFSDFVGTGTGGRVQKYSPADGKFEVWVNMVGTNGMAVDPQGRVVAASHDMQRLTRFDPATKARTQIAGSDGYLGKPFNSVNDVVVRADGNIYFTDPTYQQGGRPGQGESGFYWLSLSGKVTRIGNAVQPNGIAISPDGTWLYVASTGGTPLRKFALGDDGAADPSGAMVSASSSDGMGVDCAGNLYLTTSEAGKPVVRVLSASGQPVGLIGGFASGTSNVAFGGDGHKTLFVTAGKVLYQVRLNVPGFPN